MDKWLGKAALLLFVLAFGVFYGVDTANRGIERVHGPMEDSAAANVERASERQAALPDGVVMDHRERMNGEFGQGGGQIAAPPAEASRSNFSRLLGWVGSVLHALADRFIRLVVGIGESILTR